MAQVQVIQPYESQSEELEKVAAYCRVSTNSKDQLNSYRTQIGYYTNAISQHPGWELVDIYADEGITGTSLEKRDEFKRMLRACREGRIDLILCKSVSRFGRNSVDVLRTIRALRERGIGVMFEKEGVDTRTMNSELILAFHSAFSQSESESIRENVRRGLHMAYAQGTVAIPSNTYGFCEDENGQIAIDTEQAQVIRSIYQWFLDGKSLQMIGEQLENQGISSPRGKEKWSLATIRSILSNLFSIYHPITIVLSPASIICCLCEIKRIVWSFRMRCNVSKRLSSIFSSIAEEASSNRIIGVFLTSARAIDILCF